MRVYKHFLISINILKIPISGSKYITSIGRLENIRPEGIADAQLIFPFLGYGTYYIEFAGTNGMVTAEIDIKE